MNETRIRLPQLVAAIAFAWLVFLILYLAGRPLGTDDFWWHLKLGEIYWNAGPWLDADPLLYTSEMKPDPASWLFDIALYGFRAGLGFQGLRVVHVLLVAAILWQAYGLFRRESGSNLAAAAATAVLLCLSWYRLVQFRPDLVSILALLLIVRLLIEGRNVPSWQRIGAALFLMLLWVNSHALYLLGPLACAGGCIGVVLRGYAAREAERRGVAAPEGWADTRTAGLRLGAATLLGLGVTLLNPRGAARHLTFLRSSDERAIWRIRDEWTPFDPFDWSGTNPAESLLSMAVVDLLFAATLIVVVATAIAAVRRPQTRWIRVLDPVLVGFAAASFAAISTAIRFEWLAVFPLLLLLRAGSVWIAAKPRGLPTARVLGAILCVALALALPPFGGYGMRASGVPRNLDRYLATSINGYKYYTQGVRFLRDSGLRGNLFNSYFMGGYLGYWLAPEMLTMVGGTLNYPEEVAIAHRAIATLESDVPDADALTLLERHDVDVFLGVGMPIGGPQRGPRYTAAHLEGAPGWTLVFRSRRTAIYLRADNRENLERVSAFYASQRVPFDPAVGLDVERVIRERPGFALARGLLPQAYRRLVLESTNGNETTRLHALDRLGDIYASLGAYTSLLGNERALLAIRPNHLRAHQRLIYGLLRLDRVDEALAQAQLLKGTLATDIRSRAFTISTAQYAGVRRRSPDVHPAAGLSPARAIVNRLPLFTAEEAARAAGG